MLKWIEILESPTSYIVMYGKLRSRYHLKIRVLYLVEYTGSNSNPLCGGRVYSCYSTCGKMFISEERVYIHPGGKQWWPHVLGTSFRFLRVWSRNISVCDVCLFLQYDICFPKMVFIRIYQYEAKGLTRWIIFDYLLGMTGK